MRVAIITIAGVSSRFNEGIPENEKRHKAIYFEGDPQDSLLYHLMSKCIFVDKIVLVVGNKKDDVEVYCNSLPEDMKKKTVIVYNEHYEDLASGYSLYLGLEEALTRFEDIEDIIFVEGDLNIDRESFDKVVYSHKDVLTYTREPIYANKAVVLYRDKNGHYKYAFNSSHGLLEIEEPFSVILNSGQMWRFTQMNKLKTANDRFYSESKDGTNLRIIQNYIDIAEDDQFELIELCNWTNCNTREDYKKILSYWKEYER